MRIQIKLLIIVSLLIFLFSIVLGILFTLERYQINVLFKQEFTHAQSSFDKIKVLKSKGIETFAEGWTYWDEFVVFLQIKDQNWAIQNIDASLKTFDTDVAWVYDLGPSLVYATVISEDLNALKNLVLPEGVFPKLFDSRFMHFYINTPLGLLEVRGATIHLSADSARKGQPRGYFFCGRIVDKPYLDDLGDFMEGQVTISQSPYKDKFSLKDKTITLSLPLKGFDNEALAYMNVRVEAKAIENYARAMRQFVVIYAAFILFTFVILVVYFYLAVTLPLRLISQTLREDNPEFVTSLQVRKDEFSAIAKLIQFSFKQKKELAEEMVVREKIMHDLKEAEKQLRFSVDEWGKTFDSISDAVFIQDKDFTIIKANKATAQMLKLDLKDIIGKKCYELLHKSDHPWEDCPMEKTRKDLKAHVNEINDLRIGIPLLVTTSPIFDQKGNFVGAVHAAKDISEMKSIQEKLEKKVKDLEIFQKVAVDRELKMVELKKKISQLEERLKEH
ncbi:MAG: PAS domain-containing protein [Candidatus Omnitrophica bacterium]|nr:PAS domain-containing protein [Candidatus Omnitrophota bacterium]